MLFPELDQENVEEQTEQTDGDQEAVDGHDAQEVFVPVEELPKPWERQKGERSKPFHAFCHYRDLKNHDRSVRKGWHTHKQRCEYVETDETKQASKNWHVWCKKWSWVERAVAWDSEVDREKREKLITDQVKARQRHARIANEQLTVMSQPALAVMKALEDPEFLTNLVEQAKTGAGSAQKLLAAVARMSHAIPGVVNVERQALGMPAQSIEIDDKREVELGFAEGIPKDPKSTDLAIALLDRLSHAGESPPVGSGMLCEQGTVEDIASSKSTNEETG